MEISLHSVEILSIFIWLWRMNGLFARYSSALIQFFFLLPCGFLSVSGSRPGILTLTSYHKYLPFTNLSFPGRVGSCPFSRAVSRHLGGESPFHFIIILFPGAKLLSIFPHGLQDPQIPLRVPDPHFPVFDPDVFLPYNTKGLHCFVDPALPYGPSPSADQPLPVKRLRPGNRPGGTLPHTSSSPHPEDSLPVPAAPSDPAASSAGPAAPHRRHPSRTDTSPGPGKMRNFLAAAKSSRHGKSKTLAPRSMAAAFVPSVDPVSVTRISSGNPATLSRHRPSTSSSSFFTIMQRPHGDHSHASFHTVLLPVYVPCENS